MSMNFTILHYARFDIVFVKWYHLSTGRSQRPHEDELTEFIFNATGEIKKKETQLFRQLSVNKYRQLIACL